MGEVSYLLTSYNKAAYLPVVLDSILLEYSQTGGEIIVIDDGSTDGSLEICRQFAADNPFVKLIEQSNRGVFAALNRILPLASHPWTRLCDSDDPLTFGSTGYLCEVARQTDAAIAYGSAIDYGPEPLAVERLALEGSATTLCFIHADARTHLIEQMDFTTSRAIYRTELAKASLPLPEDLISCQDFALAIRMTTDKPLVRVPDPVCYYLVGAENQLSASEALTRHQTIRILQASKKFLRRHHRVAAIKTSYKLRRRELRSQHRGLAFHIPKNALKLFSMAARLGLYDWHRALDVFASHYENRIPALISRRAKPY
jgi:glycosyltransferase involved in cell wall biosynthesis